MCENNLVKILAMLKGCIYGKLSWLKLPHLVMIFSFSPFFLSYLVSPIITLTTEPENINPTTTSELEVICSVISHPQIQTGTLTLVYSGNIDSGAAVELTNDLRVSVVALDERGLILQRYLIHFTCKY